MKFRTKPVVIEAIQYTGTDESYAAVCAFAPGVHFEPCGDRKFHVPTLEGPHIASPGDWIIRGVKGELYPCKPDIFSATYDAADDRSRIDRGDVITDGGHIIMCLLRAADVAPGQDPAIACGVALRNGVQLEGSLSLAPDGGLRMLCPTADQSRSSSGVQMLELFFSASDVMTVAVRRTVSTSKPIIVQG